MDELDWRIYHQDFVTYILQKFQLLTNYENKKRELFQDQIGCYLPRELFESFDFYAPPVTVCFADDGHNYSELVA